MLLKKRDLGLTPISLAFLLCLAWGCNSPDPSNSGGKSAPVAGLLSPGDSSGSGSGNLSPAAVQVKAQLQTLATTLNATPTYTLSNDDLQLLSASGVLSDGDNSALLALVQR